MWLGLMHSSAVRERVADIFFSYSSHDRERVRQVRDALADKGFDVFWDQQTPAGMDWEDPGGGHRSVGNKISWRRTRGCDQGARTMASRTAKIDLPVDEIRRYLEPGPIVLVSSAHGGKRNIMTMGWHTVMEFTPSLVGCVIAGGNYSFDLIRRSRECVINLPTIALTDAAVGIGNTSGAGIDKFEHFRLTAEKARRVKAPLIRECHASLECRLADDCLVDRYNFFIFEVVKAHVATAPKHPRTLHYTGDGVFMVSGESSAVARCSGRRCFSEGPAVHYRWIEVLSNARAAAVERWLPWSHDIGHSPGAALQSCSW
jgi:flavin reductase (DIM6/NTAB) family NADH-FMN oxidoreductase RutF